MDQALNKDKYRNHKDKIAQIKDGAIVDFFDQQAILEIFDVDDIPIPHQGLLYNGYLATRQAKLVSCARLDPGKVYNIGYEG